MDDKTILVDTSAWIEAFKGRLNLEKKTILQNAIESERAVTSPLIILELLQGCRNRKEKTKLRNLMTSLRQLDLNSALWEKAYELGFNLRRKGMTIATVDLILSALAIHYGCTILHKDRHFNLVAENTELNCINI